MDGIFKKFIQFILKWLAKIYLLENKPYVIVVSGTTGRFWIKEKIIEALEGRNFLFRTNRKNFNAELGLPLSILGLPSGERSFLNWMKILMQAVKMVINPRKFALDQRGSAYLVLEMAVDRPENMDYLVSIVKPNLAVLTTITMVYQENFESLDEIANEYKKLIKALPWNGILVLNNDDQRIKNLKEYFKGKVVAYGFSDSAQFKALDVYKITDGQMFKMEIQKKEKEIINCKINRFGRHHIYAELVKEIIKDNFKEQQREFFGKILDMASE